MMDDDLAFRNGQLFSTARLDGALLSQCKLLASGALDLTSQSLMDLGVTLAWRVASCILGLMIIENHYHNMFVSVCVVTQLPILE